MATFDEQPQPYMLFQSRLVLTNNVAVDQQTPILTTQQDVRILLCCLCHHRLGRS